MTTLADAVRQRIVDVEEQAELSVELARAEALSDLFSHVTPETYVLPLDALAGFAAPGENAVPNVDDAVDMAA